MSLPSIKTGLATPRARFRLSICSWQITGETMPGENPLLEPVNFLMEGPFNTIFYVEII